MQTAAKTKYTYWQEGNWWLGYLMEFPDYITQGESLQELRDHLADLYKDLTDGNLPSIRRMDELDLS